MPLTRKLDSRLLRCFLAVYEHRNITAAAASLHMTQSTISKAIGRLEDSLGVRLFERLAVGVVATEYGRALERRAKVIELESEQALEEIEYIREGGRGAVVIGVAPSWSVYGVPAIVAKLSVEMPHCTFTIKSAVLDTLIPDLLEGSVDIVCSSLDYPDHPDIVKEHLFDATHVLLADARHPLMGSSQVSPEDLLKYPWISLSLSYAVTNRVASFFSGHRLGQPRFAIETNSVECMFSVLLQGPFIAALPSPLLGRAQALGLGAISTAQSFWRYRSGMAYRTHSRESPVIGPLIGALGSLRQNMQPSVAPDAFSEAGAALKAR